MFDVGMMEMFVVVVLAIIVVGPKDLPKLLRSVGRFVAKIRAMGQEFQNTIKQMSDEIELEEVTRKLNEAGNIPLDDLDTAPDIRTDMDTAPDIKTDIKNDMATGPETSPETEVKTPKPGPETNVKTEVKPDADGPKADEQ